MTDRYTDKTDYTDRVADLKTNIYSNQNQGEGSHF